MPFCPVDRSARREMIEALDAGGYELTEVYRNDAYILLELQAP